MRQDLRWKPSGVKENNVDAQNTANVEREKESNAICKKCIPCDFFPCGLSLAGL